MVKIKIPITFLSLLNIASEDTGALHVAEDHQMASSQPTAWRLLLPLCLAFAIAPCVNASGAEKDQGFPRVAILAAAGSDTPLADLLQAALSKTRNAILVERGRVNELLAERELSAGFLSYQLQTSETPLPLEYCDLIAVISSTGPQTAATSSVQLFDTSLGRRFADVSAGGMDETATIEQRVERLASAIQSGIQKWRKAQAGTMKRTVALISVRNAGLPQNMASLPDASLLLLQRRLTNLDGIAVLERRMLGYVNNEVSLSADQRGALLSSVELINVELATGADGSIRAKAVVTDTKGAPMGECAASSREPDPASVADSLAEALQIRWGMSTASSPPVSRTAESMRFLLEYTRVREAVPAEAALPVAESAHALDPDSFPCQAALCDALERQADALVETGKLDKAYDLLIRSLSIRGSWETVSKDRYDGLVKLEAPYLAIIVRTRLTFQLIKRFIRQAMMKPWVDQLDVKNLRLLVRKAFDASQFETRFYTRYSCSNEGQRPVFDLSQIMAPSAAAWIEWLANDPSVTLDDKMALQNPSAYGGYNDQIYTTKNLSPREIAAYDSFLAAACANISSGPSGTGLSSETSAPGFSSNPRFIPTRTCQPSPTASSHPPTSGKPITDPPHARTRRISRLRAKNWHS